jgi:hypothetical protein
MADETILCQKGMVTVAKCRAMIERQDRDALAGFIRDRFTERYITPLESIPQEPKHLRNGFCTMAICCLMIEALESFWQGLPDTNFPRGSSGAFCSFFDRSDNLKAFRGHARDFYTHVRCGILHQAETTGGWKIRRKGILFDPTTTTINATRFHRELARCLDTYHNALASEPWKSEVWAAFNKKIKAIFKNA